MVAALRVAWTVCDFCPERWAPAVVYSRCPAGERRLFEISALRAGRGALRPPHRRSLVTTAGVRRR